MTDNEIEQEIQEKGLTAARVTPQDVADAISGEYYFTAGQGMYGNSVWPADIPAGAHMVTFCLMILKNGHRIVGINTGSISPENFDADLARKLARQNAVDQIWPLLGYALRDRTYHEGLNSQALTRSAL